MLKTFFSFLPHDRPSFTHLQTREKVWFSVLQNNMFFNSVFLIHRNIRKKTNIFEIFELHYYILARFSQVKCWFIFGQTHFSVFRKHSVPYLALIH